MNYNSFLYFNMSAIHIVTILLACTVPCSLTSGFFFDTNPKLHEGNLIPLDPDVCTTQNITFTCTLRSSPKPNNTIGFAVKNESTNTKFLPVDEGRITVVNETSSTFTIYNINATTYMFVSCYYWEMFGDMDPSLQLGHTTTASVYFMPEKVEHVDCIVDNYMDSMRCSWNYGDKYKKYDINLPDVEFQWRTPEVSGSWNNCPELNKKDGYCSWKNTDSGDFSLKINDFKLTLTEPCGVKVSSNYTINTSQIVKPRPVIGLNSLVLNSTCIKVQWQTNYSRPNYSKEHKLIVSDKWDDPQEYTFTTTKTTEKETHGMTVCNLHPHTVYTFNVSIQPTGGQAGFYSDSRETVATTYSDIPSASPDITEGGYSWTPRDCEEVNDKRTVCVFWQAIRDEDKNGQIKGLDGTFTAVNQTRPPIDVSWAEDLTYGCSSGLLCNINYEFTVKARNSNGTSKDNSKLVISAASGGIVQPQFIVETANISNVSVSWLEAEKATGYLVAWCRNKNGECENRNKVNWQRFPSSTREAVLQINPENSPQDFLYGVSVSTKQGSSGVEWQDCVYLKNAYPKREPQNVVVSAGSDDNTLVVTWDKLSCKSDEPYIAKYNVQYNKLHEANQKSKQVTASGEARVVLKDLEDKQTYIVTVRGITSAGHYGPKSQPQKGVPVDNSLNPGAIVGISLGLLVVVLLAGVGCFLTIRKCKKMADKTRARLAVITIPDNIPDNMPFRHEDTMEEHGFDGLSTRSVERQNSNDSGFDPMTPPAGKFKEQPKFVDKSLINNPQAPPDDYHKAALGAGQNLETRRGCPDVEMDSFNTALDNKGFISSEKVVAQVGFVMNGTVRTSKEAFVKQVDKDTVINQTAVKTRVKNVSGDSGVSDAYSKATLSTLEEKISNDNGQDVNNAYIENKRPDDKVISTSFKTSHITQQACSTIIPTPLAFSDCILGDSFISDQEDDNTTVHVADSSVGSSMDYVLAQSAQDDANDLFSHNYIATIAPTTSTDTNVDNYQSHFHGLENKNKRNEDNKSRSKQELTAASVQPLTKIPCPKSMDDSDNSSSEEETVSATLAGVSPPEKSQTGSSKIDDIEQTNNSTSVTGIPPNLNSLSHHEHENDQVSCYVTTTDMPNKSLKCAPRQQANTGTWYVTLSNTGTPVTGSPHGIPDQISYINPQEIPDHAHVSVSESQTSKKNSYVSPDYVTSVTNPIISHQTQALLHSSQVGSETSSYPSPSYFLSEGQSVQIPPHSSDQTNSTLPAAHSDKFSCGIADNLEAGRYRSHNTVAVSVPTSASPISICSDGYLPHLHPIQGQMSSSGSAENATDSADIKSNMSDSSVENNFSSVEVGVATCQSASKSVGSESSATSSNVLSENDSLPNSTKQTSSGYVTNTDFCSAFATIAFDGYDVKNKYKVTTAQNADTFLKECYPGTDQSLSSELRMVAFNNNQPNENVPDENTNETNETERQNNVQTSEMQLPTGYVGHQFIPQENHIYKKQPVPDNKDQPSVEMRYIEKHNNEDDHGSKRGSDSGLSSLEN